MAGHVKIVNPKVRRRLRRKASVRLRVSGTPERPRLSVFRSAKHIYVQAVDDVSGRVLAAASDLAPDVKAAVEAAPTDGQKLKKKDRARLVGKTIGAKLLGLQIESVVFDRNGFMYHGRVKEVADGAREAGLKF